MMITILAHVISAGLETRPLRLEANQQVRTRKPGTAAIWLLWPSSTPSLLGSLLPWLYLILELAESAFVASVLNLLPTTTHSPPPLPKGGLLNRMS